jgi:hypothetical protein
MIIGVSYFGDKAFLPLVEAWLKAFKKSGCKYRVVITTDLNAIVPKESVPYDPNGVDPLSHIRIDTALYPDIIRSKRAFDMQGALSTQAIQILPRCLIVDADAFFVKDPTPIIEKLPNVLFGMGEEPNIRQIEGIDEYLRECNAGVLYFGTDDRADRVRLAEMYRANFKALKPKNDNLNLEQITWTYVKHQLSKEALSCDLPPALNWSHVWKNPHRRRHLPNIGEPYILHEHGPHKWKFIQGLELDSNNKPKPKYTNYYSK